jgi:hypothetical protein
MDARPFSGSKDKHRSLQFPASPLIGTRYSLKSSEPLPGRPGPSRPAHARRCRGISQGPSDHRANSMIQFVSHVLPPSSELACSQCADAGVICDHIKRARTVFPFTTLSE